MKRKSILSVITLAALFNVIPASAVSLPAMPSMPEMSLPQLNLTDSVSAAYQTVLGLFTLRNASVGAGVIALAIAAKVGYDKYQENQKAKIEAETLKNAKEMNTEENWSRK